MMVPKCQRSIGIATSSPLIHLDQYPFLPPSFFLPIPFPPSLTLTPRLLHIYIVWIEPLAEILFKVDTGIVGPKQRLGIEIVQRAGHGLHELVREETCRDFGQRRRRLRRWVDRWRAINSRR